MKALFIKELESLRPYFLAALLLALGALGIAVFGVADPARPSALFVESLDGGFFVGGTICLIAGLFSCGSEARDGTLNFFDTLPVSRGQLHAAKMLALLVLILAVAACGLVPPALQLAAAGALPRAGPVLSKLGALYASGLLGCAGLGLFFGSGRRPGVFSLLTVLLLLEVLGEVSAHAAPARVSTLFQIPMRGAEPIVPPVAHAVWLSFFAAGVLGSRFGLGAAGRRKEARFDAVRFGFVLVVVFVAVSSTGIAVQVAPKVQALLRSRPTISQPAPHLSVLFHPEDVLAAELSRLVPEVDRRVREALDTAPRRIDVELIGAGAFHAGEQQGRNVRVDPSAPGAASVLHHELVHAYADALAGPRGRALLDAWRAFGEGAATLLGAELSGERAELDEMLVSAGHLHARGGTSLGLLLRGAERQKWYDHHEIYPLGVVFVEALRDEAGPGVVGCVFRALSTAPQGGDLWRHLGARCEFELPSVAARYQSRLDGLVPGEPLTLPVPRLTWELPLSSPPSSTSGLDGLELTVDPGLVDEQPFVFRTRVRPLAADHEIDQGGRFGAAVSARHLGAQRLWAQVGFLVPNGRGPMFGPWMELDVPPRPGRTWTRPAPRLRDPAALDERRELVRLSEPTAIRISPAKDLAAFVQRERLSVFSVPDLQLVRSFEVGAEASDVGFALDGRVIVALADHGLRAFRLADGALLWSHTAASLTAGLSTSPDGSLVAMVRTVPDALSIYDASTGAMLATVPVGESLARVTLAWRPDGRVALRTTSGRRLVISPEGGAVREEEGIPKDPVAAEGGASLPPIAPNVQTDAVFGVFSLPDGDIGVVHEGGIQTWDQKSCRPRRFYPRQEKVAAIDAVVPSPNGRRVLLRGRDGSAFWDQRTGAFSSARRLDGRKPAWLLDDGWVAVEDGQLASSTGTTVPVDGEVQDLAVGPRGEIGFVVFRRDGQFVGFELRVLARPGEPDRIFGKGHASPGIAVGAGVVVWQNILTLEARALDSGGLLWSREVPAVSRVLRIREQRLLWGTRNGFWILDLDDGRVLNHASTPRFEDGALLVGGGLALGHPSHVSVRQAPSFAETCSLWRGADGALIWWDDDMYYGSAEDLKARLRRLTGLHSVSDPQLDACAARGACPRRILTHAGAVPGP